MINDLDFKTYASNTIKKDDIIFSVNDTKVMFTPQKIDAYLSRTQVGTMQTLEDGDNIIVVTVSDIVYRLEAKNVIIDVGVYKADISSLNLQEDVKIAFFDTDILMSFWIGDNDDFLTTYDYLKVNIISNTINTITTNTTVYNGETIFINAKECLLSNVMDNTGVFTANVSIDIDFEILYSYKLDGWNVDAAEITQTSVSTEYKYFSKFFDKGKILLDNRTISAFIKDIMQNGYTFLTSYFTKGSSFINGRKFYDCHMSPCSLNEDGLVCAIGNPNSPYNSINNPNALFNIYSRSSSVSDWNIEQRVTDIENIPYDTQRLGDAVALSDDALVCLVSSISNNTVYVLQRDTKYDNFKKVFDIVSPDTGTFEDFGHSVAMSGDGLHCCVAQKTDSTLETPPNAKLYTFARADRLSNFSNVQYINEAESHSPLTDLKFGSSLSLSRDGLTLIVGEMLNSEDASNNGAVYEFVRNDFSSSWVEKIFIGGGTLSTDMKLGVSVAIAPNKLSLLVGFGKIGVVNIYKRSSELDQFQYSNIVSGTENYIDNGIVSTSFGSDISISLDSSTIIIGDYLRTIDTVNAPNKENGAVFTINQDESKKYILGFEDIGYVPTSTSFKVLDTTIEVEKESDTWNGSYFIRKYKNFYAIGKHFAYKVTAVKSGTELLDNIKLKIFKLIKRSCDGR